MRGSRASKIGKIEVCTLRPAEAVEFDVFALMPSIKRAQAHHLSWDLKGVQSNTLTLEMIYEVTEEGGRDAVAHRAPEVAVGTWTTKPVILPYGK